MKGNEVCKECGGSGVRQLYIGSMTVCGPCPVCNKKHKPSKTERKFLDALDKLIGKNYSTVRRYALVTSTGDIEIFVGTLHQAIKESYKNDSEVHTIGYDNKLDEWLFNPWDSSESNNEQLQAYGLRQVGKADSREVRKWGWKSYGNIDHES